MSKQFPLPRYNLNPNPEFGIRRNWELNAPMNEDLREIMEPLALYCVDTVLSELAGTSYQERQDIVEDAGNIYSLPYGRVAALPPGLFGDITADSITLTRRPVVPLYGSQIPEMVSTYMDRSYDMPFGKQSSAFLIYKDIFTKALQVLKGMDYPIADWYQSAAVVQQALKMEPFNIINVHFVDLIENAASDYEQLNMQTKASHSQHKSYVLVMSSDWPMSDILRATTETAKFPIGEYGIDASGKLARVVIVLNNRIKNSLLIDNKVRTSMTTTKEVLLERHTARSRALQQRFIHDSAVHGVKQTLSEGVLSIAQVLSFLTAKKVPGYDNFDALVSDLLDSGIVEQFTRSVRPGYIGPATLAGLYVPNALENKKGNIALSKSLLDVLCPMRKQYLASLALEWALYRQDSVGTKEPDVLGLMCPAAAPKGAITTFKAAFKAFYDSKS